MKKLNINLASEPFRRDRHVIAGLTVAATALTVLLAILVALAVSARGRASQMRAEVERLNRTARELASQQSGLDGTLRQPANSEVLERSVLLNTLLTRKGISWTRIFADLEKVLPGNVRLISIQLPHISGQGRVTLDMIVGAQAPEPGSRFPSPLGRLAVVRGSGRVHLHGAEPERSSVPLSRECGICSETIICAFPSATPAALCRRVWLSSSF